MAYFLITLWCCIDTLYRNMSWWH